MLERRGIAIGSVAGHNFGDAAEWKLGAAGHLTISETLAVSIIWGAVLIMSSAVNGVFLIGHWKRGAKAPSEPSSGTGRRK